MTLEKHEYFQSRTKLFCSLRNKHQRSKDLSRKQNHHIAAHKWMTIRHLCVRLEKKSLIAAREQRTVYNLSNFGITSNYKQNLEKLIFFPFKAVFLEWGWKTFGLCTIKHAPIHFRQKSSVPIHGESFSKSVQQKADWKLQLREHWKIKVQNMDIQDTVGTGGHEFK